MTRDAAIKHLGNMKWLKGYSNTTVDDIPLGSIIDEIIALLKAQEPRVMTLEEMQKNASIRDGAVWLEAGAGLMPAFMEFATKDITFFVAVPLTGYRQFFENDWYGKTWRCWTIRPDEKRRVETPWDG